MDYISFFFFKLWCELVEISFLMREGKESWAVVVWNGAKNQFSVVSCAPARVRPCKVHHTGHISMNRRVVKVARSRGFRDARWDSLESLFSFSFIVLAASTSYFLFNVFFVLWIFNVWSNKYERKCEYFFLRLWHYVTKKSLTGWFGYDGRTQRSTPRYII